MAVIGSYNAFIFLAKSPGFLPNVIIWFCNKLSALWEEAVFAKKKRGNALFCNSHKTKFMPAIKASIQSRPIKTYFVHFGFGRRYANILYWPVATKLVWKCSCGGKIVEMSKKIKKTQEVCSEGFLLLSYLLELLSTHKMPFTRKNIYSRANFNFSRKKARVGRWSK